MFLKKSKFLEFLFQLGYTKSQEIIASTLKCKSQIMYKMIDFAKLSASLESKEG